TPSSRAMSFIRTTAMMLDCSEARGLPGRQFQPALLRLRSRLLFQPRLAVRQRLGIFDHSGRSHALDRHRVIALAMLVMPRQFLVSARAERIGRQRKIDERCKRGIGAAEFLLDRAG